MSSSNIHSTVNQSSATTSSASTDALPSVFELLAEERLSELLRPCLQQMIKKVYEWRSTSKIMRTLYACKEELILLIEGCIQWLYITHYNALLGERFYGFRRTAENRVRSLIITVFLPYVKRKLDAICEKSKENSSSRHRYFFMIAQVLPKIETFFEGICWLYRIGYAFGKTEYYSPMLQIAGVKLVYAIPKTLDGGEKSKISRLFSVVNQTFSAGLFLIQFADWAKTSSGIKTGNTTSKVPMPAKRSFSGSGSRRKCDLCGKQPCENPTVVSGSGYVYCFQCISDYVENNHCCPKTKEPITSASLIKIYMS